MTKRLSEDKKKMTLKKRHESWAKTKEEKLSEKN